MKSRKELLELGYYLRGYADANENVRMAEASDALISLSRHVCGQGFICNIGDNCSSDHK